MRFRPSNGWIGGAVTVALALGLVAGASAGGAPKRQSPAKDSFAGRITAATGSFDGDSGKLRLVLRPRSGDDTRHVIAYLAGRPCHEQAHCLRLRGKLTGTMTEAFSGADRGNSFKIDASGRVAPVGQVTAHGQGHGTGFIVYGREQLRLRLRNASSEITITASSERVPGFTSP